MLLREINSLFTGQKLSVHPTPTSSMVLLRTLRNLVPLPAAASGNRGAAYKRVVVALVYISLVLDNVLLTVVGLCIFKISHMNYVQLQLLNLTISNSSPSNLVCKSTKSNKVTLLTHLLTLYVNHVSVPIIPDFLYQVEHNGGGTAVTEAPMNVTTLPPGKASISNVRVRYPGGAPFLLPQNQGCRSIDF